MSNYFISQPAIATIKALNATLRLASASAPLRALRETIATSVTPRTTTLGIQQMDRASVSHFVFAPVFGCLFSTIFR
jgi:hypothetical protein